MKTELCFFFLSAITIGIGGQTMVYIASTANPPHGCPNFALCSQPTATLINATTDVETYQMGCSSLDDCVCVKGTTNNSNACDTIIDSCSSSPCPNTNYTCVNGINSRSCRCNDGLTGSSCQYEIATACGQVKCQNSGTCQPEGDTFKCACKNGYYGDLCQYTDWCSPNPCANGATCHNVLNSSTFECLCADYWQGHWCSVSTIQYAANYDRINCYKYQNLLESSATYAKSTSSGMRLNICADTAKSKLASYFTVCGASCYTSNVQLLNTTSMSGDCWSGCPGYSGSQCGKDSKECQVYSYNYTIDPNPCLNTSLCNVDRGQGICVDAPSATTNYYCICGPNFVGGNCQTEVAGACDDEPCLNGGTCLLKEQYNNFTCQCQDPYYGPLCQYTSVCKTSSPCLYGGTCNDRAADGYWCSCLEYYSGPDCKNVNRCTYANPCVNGTCSTNGTMINSVPYSCTCDWGFTGEHCDTEINFCTTYTPCAYNSTCTPSFGDYNCSCVYGTTGKNCSEMINYCVYTQIGGSWYKSPCNTRDNLATCSLVLGGYTCNCSSQWTGSTCALNVIIEQVLVAIYGSVNDEMLSLLNDLMSNPTEIKDMVPFIVGLLSSKERMELSWDASDLFLWIAYEQKKLDFEKDIHKWNDVVLGNCFTFNHMDQNFTYTARNPGPAGGLRAYLQVRQDEYAPWYDTAGIGVFVTNKDDYVFSESVRYNVQPDSEAMIKITPTDYTRLGGIYGICIKKTSEVKSYYYPGSYSTNGCLRACYQNMIYSTCSCMDPRYPMPYNMTSCQLSERTCVDKASDDAGDPSTWSSCVCPLPCSERQFSVAWSKADFVSEPTECSASNSIANCAANMSDRVMVTVQMPRLDYEIYSENPALEFNDFISNLGGLLGVLMGVCFISFIELFLLIFTVIYAILSKNKR